jgi:hypothetical protein
MIVIPISTKVCNVVKYDFLAALQGNILEIALMSFQLFFN